MAKRNLYAILGISESAGPTEIKQAYRRLAFAHHPDVGPNPDPERFREIHEAYEVLSDPEQRRAYDLSTASQYRATSPEPLYTSQPINIVVRHRTAPPPTAERLYPFSQNFPGYGSRSRGFHRRLGIEAILEPHEARFGCRLPIRLPCYVECSECNGAGEIWRWYLCPSCRGRGMVETVSSTTIQIPAGARNGDRYEFRLSGMGIEDLVLDVRITVP